MTAITLPRFQANPIAASLMHQVEIWQRAIRARRVYKSTYRQLSALSARELDDIGLNASMIRSVALKAAADMGA